jgi:hypothetical protein
MNIVLNDTEIANIKKTLLDLLGKIDASEKLLNTPIIELPLSVRAYNICCLMIKNKFKITQTWNRSESMLVRHLITFTESDFMNTRCCGYKTLEEIRDVFTQLGFELEYK